MVNFEKDINIEAILSKISTNTSVSDIHIGADDFIAFRINGEVQKYDKIGKLPEEYVEIMLKHLMKGNQKAYEKFVGDKEADFSYVSNDGTPYRVNAFFKLWKVGIVMRKINSLAKDLSELMFSDVSEVIKTRILTKKTWLVIVTWPTGSGKSTSIVSMINHINTNRAENIITIEDPIEFIFKPEKSIISQREVWHDTWSFLNALRAAMREDPNVIFVWEIRDKETADAVLALSETWHLVFSTLHTPSAAGTVNRFISFFPPEIQDSVASRLSDTLLAVLSQFLVKNNDGKSRVAIYELMLNSLAVRNNIVKRQILQIDNVIETNNSNGMISMKQYAQRLLDKWIVTDDAVAFIMGNLVS